jgi:hypothetical protein
VEVESEVEVALKVDRIWNWSRGGSKGGPEVEIEVEVEVRWTGSGCEIEPEWKWK